MKNVELDSRGTIVRRLPVWLFPAALACVGVGAMLLPLDRPEHRQGGHAPSQSANVDQSVEIDRLRNAVNLLEHKSEALALAVSSREPEMVQRPRDEEHPKAAAEGEDTRSASEMQHDEITALEVRFESEKDGSRDCLLATRAMQAELDAAPLEGARIKEVACSISLCRVTLEQDASSKPVDMNALIEATPTVRRESMFNYEEVGSIKRVTIYSAREGHRLSSSELDSAPVAPSR